MAEPVEYNISPRLLLPHGRQISTFFFLWLFFVLEGERLPRTESYAILDIDSRAIIQLRLHWG